MPLPRSVGAVAALPESGERPPIWNVYGFVPATHDWNVPVAVQGTLTYP
jgi:hypothetical protein